MEGEGKEISEAEWCQSLEKCPALKRALISDLDPDTGKLRSYRSQEDQLAMLLGNIQRLEYDIAKGDGEAWSTMELAARQQQVILALAPLGRAPSGPVEWGPRPVRAGWWCCRQLLVVQF